jgi:aminoglycoside 3-N-acetyltransferase
VVSADHALDRGFGELTPLARVYELDGQVLLLGAGHDSNTSLHLAEHRVRAPKRRRYAAAVTGARGREWVTWEDVDVNSGDFERLGSAFDATGAVRRGRVGSADCRLMSQRAAVDFAVGWLEANRP